MSGIEGGLHCICNYYSNFIETFRIRQIRSTIRFEIIVARIMCYISQEERNDYERWRNSKNMSEAETSCTKKKEFTIEDFMKGNHMKRINISYAEYRLSNL